METRTLIGKKHQFIHNLPIKPSKITIIKEEFENIPHDQLHVVKETCKCCREKAVDRNKKMKLIINMNGNPFQHFQG